MSVRPTSFNADGSVDIWHEERGHGGTVAAADIRFVPHAKTEADDIRYLALPCPVPGCGSASAHPASGGADPDRVQRLFAYQYLRNVSHPDLARLTSWSAAKGKLKQIVEEMDGLGRFRLDNVPEGG